MPYTISKAAMSDLEDIALLYHELVGSKEDINRMKETYNTLITNEHIRVLVAKDDENHVIGTISGYICPILFFTCSALLVIEGFIVSQTYQGKGIGTRLLDAMDAFALENRCHHAILVSSESRNSAHRLYLKKGFNQDEAVKGFRKTY
jgi:GNAT superfamily N-acetyltransferase